MRPRRIGYAKLGRSMPLSLAKCGSSGGDVEMLPTLKLLAERHPDVEFVLIGRNSGEHPAVVDLPENVDNPWTVWQLRIRAELNAASLNHPNWTIEEHVRVCQILQFYTLETIENLDGIVMWVGQHGTTNTPLPSLQRPGTLTKPYDWSELYCSYLLQGINTWRDVDPLNREEVLLNADPRNVVKYRDSKWPWRFPVLSQYERVDNVKHERYGDPASQPVFDEFYEQGVRLHDGIRSHIWTSQTRSVYSRLEISGLLPGTPFADTIKFNDDHDRPHDFGIVFNETSPDVAVEKSRRYILDKWVLPLGPGYLAGKWSAKTLKQLGLEIEPVHVQRYFELLPTARCTLTTPSSGSGWATAKPWEAFAAGVVCFFHPAYDDQNHILSDAPRALEALLRVNDPLQLRDRVRYMRDHPEYWRDVVHMQRRHFDRAVEEKRYLKEIEKRLGL